MSNQSDYSSTSRRRTRLARLDTVPWHLLPDKWREWHVRVCDLLDIQADAPISAQHFPTPWFLIPKHPELQEAEADNLIQSIREFLYSQGHSISEVRKRIRSLSLDAALPFLYLMRYIAFREAEQHSYWPAFRKVLFDDELSYNDVALRLASPTSSLWLQLYDATGGALYYPREGLRHIKWPLAHAGLIQEDKDILGAFGLSLFSSGDDLYSNVLALEIDEFILFFRDWSQTNRRSTNGRFVRLMESHVPERETIAELGQQWLGFHYEQIEGQYRSQRENPKRSVIPMRRRFVYDSRDNRLGLLLEIDRIKDVRDIRLEWDSRRFQFQFQFLASTKETIPLPIFIPVETPSWPAAARLWLGSTSYDICMPSFESNKSIVFELASGKQTKRWELGQEYYILVRGELLTVERTGKIFEDWIALGEPRGNWKEYSLLWVRTQDPFATGEVKTQDITALLGALEQAVDDLALPSFGGQHRVRASLIGGQFTDVDVSSTPVFLAERPPYLEIRGVWNTSVSVSLLRTNDISGQYTAISELSVASDLSGSSHIIELWEYHAEPGAYRLLVGDNKIDFIVKARTPTNIQEGIKQFNLAAEFKDMSANPVINPSRHALSDLILAIQAWPQADLVLEIENRHVQYIQRIPLQTDEDGQWAQTITSLPIDFSIFPEGDVIFRVGWRGIFSSEIIAPDTIHVSAKSVQTAVYDTMGSFLVTCQGSIGSTSDIYQHFGVLLSEIPWQHPPKKFSIPVDPYGNFQVETHSSFEPVWLVIFRQESDQRVRIAVITAVALRDKTILSAKSFDNPLGLAKDYPVSWPFLARAVARIPHPPSLDSYLLMEPVLTLLSKTILPFQERWKFFRSWNQLELVHSYTKIGCPIALFRVPSPGKVGQPVSGIKIDFSGFTAVSDELPFCFDREGSEAVGRIIRDQFLDEDRFKFEADVAVYGCSKCQLIVPASRFDDHLAPYTECENCTGIGPAFVSYIPDRKSTEHIVIGVLIDPLRRYAAIEHQLMRVLQGEQDIPLVYRSLMKDLRSLVPKEADSKEWLRKLVVALQEYETLLHQKIIQIDDLLEVAQVIRGYEDALKIILDATEMLVA